MTSEMFHWTYAAITQGLIIGFCTAALIGPVNFLAIRRGILGGFQPAFLVGAGAALVDASCAYLVFAGIFQGLYWASLRWWDDSVNVSIPFWWVRIVAGLAIMAGQVCFFVNLYKTWKAASSTGAEPQTI